MEERILEFMGQVGRPVNIHELAKELNMSELEALGAFGEKLRNKTNLVIIRLSKNNDCSTYYKLSRIKSA